MQDGEIPRGEWTRSLDDFSKEHQGWFVKIEVINKEIGDQEEGSRLPLVGISADLKDREERIVVMTGDGRQQHLTHIINKPKHLWFASSGGLVGDAIKIEDEDGTTTIL
jgi:hypothetical protein